MISQTLRSMATESSAKIADLGAVMDGSMKLRLQQMRVWKETESVCLQVEDPDNCIAAAMYAIYNFARLRHADKIGATYWMVASEDGQTLVPVDFFTMLDGKVQSIRRSNAILSGDLEFPANTWESDMECLVTFVEHSSKSKIVGQYRTLQSKMDAAKQNEPARSMESFEPTGSHRAVNEMQGINSANSIGYFTNTWVHYEDGEYTEALDTAHQIEQYTETVPVAGKPTKNREKRIAQDKDTTEMIDLSYTSKPKRKSDKTVIDVSGSKKQHDADALMPTKKKSKSNRVNAPAKVTVRGL